MKSILVCFALKEEAAPFHAVAARHPGVITLIVGIGRGNAEKSIRKFFDACSSRGDGTQAGQPETSHIVSYRPDLVLTCGFAGGLDPNLKIGDVVFEIRNPKSEIRNPLVAAGARPAKFFCAERIAITVAEKKALREQTGADAVEMESAAIHAVCAETNIPCVTVRVISDTADEDLPLDFNALARPDKSVDFGKLAWAIAKSPGKIPQLMALQKKTRFAAQRLTEALDQIL